MIIVAAAAVVIALGIQFTTRVRLREIYLNSAAGHAYAEQSLEEMLSKLAESRGGGSIDQHTMNVLSSLYGPATGSVML